MSRPKGESPWLTSEAARADAQKLRRRCDAILVGAETVRADDPRLTVRGPSARGGKEQPYRVVMTRSGNLPPTAAIFTDEHRERTLVVRNQSIRQVLKRLGTLGVNTVLIEGGGTILAQAFSHGLVDEVCFYLAPLISGSGRPVVDPGFFRGSSAGVANLEIRRVGPDIRISGTLGARS